jgi:hypothetical protein
MGQIDYRCYKIAHKIITELFMVKYKECIKDNNINCINNLNNYILKEYEYLNSNIVSAGAVVSPFTAEEVDMIMCDSTDILLMELEIYDDNKLEKQIDWEKFNDIIVHYIYNVNLTNKNHNVVAEVFGSINAYCEIHKDLICVNDTLELITNNPEGYEKHKVISIINEDIIFERII